jgi:hypothetical protein
MRKERAIEIVADLGYVPGMSTDGSRANDGRNINFHRPGCDSDTWGFACDRMTVTRRGNCWVIS